MTPAQQALVERRKAAQQKIVDIVERRTGVKITTANHLAEAYEAIIETFMSYETELEKRGEREI